ncbi:MAG: type II secretion system protein GspL [Yersinia sp. (in: enterobacteria)]
MLVIRFGNTECDPVYWRMDEKDDERSQCGVLDNISELNKLSLYFKSGVKVLVSSSRIIFRKMHIANTRMLRSIKSISFAMEKSIFDNIDDFHISILKYNNDFIYVAAVEHKLMVLWLSWLKNAGIKIKIIIPDVLTLPFIKGEWCAVKLDKEWIVRNNEMSGFSVSEVLFEKIYLFWYLSTPVNTVSRSNIKAINWRIIKNKEPLHFIAENIQHCNSNLLTGKYRFYDKDNISYVYTLRSVSYVILLYLIMCLNTWYDGYKIIRATDELYTHSNEFYSRFSIADDNHFNDYINSHEHSMDFISLLSSALVFFDDNNLNITGFQFDKEKKEIIFDIDSIDDGIRNNWLNKSYKENNKVLISEINNDSGKYRVTFKYNK